MSSSATVARIESPSRKTTFPLGLLFVLWTVAVKAKPRTTCGFAAPTMLVEVAFAAAAAAEVTVTFTADALLAAKLPLAGYAAVMP